VTLTRLIKICLKETCSKVHVGKHLPGAFPIQNGLNDALPLLILNFALGYSMRKVQDNVEKLELNGRHKLLV